MPYKLLFGVAAIAGLFIANHFAENDEETVPENSNEAVKDEAEDELADDVLYYDEEDDAYVPIVDNGLRRGDRFICPDTEQELQIRAVGGRPKKIQK